MLLNMLQFISFARHRATAGAINFNKGKLIPSSPVATFDGSDLMISKTSSYLKYTLNLNSNSKNEAFSFRRRENKGQSWYKQEPGSWYLRSLFWKY